MKIAELYGKLSAPARRALQELKLKEVAQLSRYTRAEIAGLHGIGPSAMKIIEAELASMNVAFKQAEAEKKAKPAGGSSLIDDYIGQFPKATQARLNEIRRIIREEAPEATERISYQMPCFYLNGNLVYFAGYEKHIGIYPLPSGIEAFKAELEAYKNAKGSVQFPLDSPLPMDLIRRMVRFRVQENLAKGGWGKKKKSG
jgi:uncharacterized protein YdhG (YjbR/CyaY superfamily)